MDARRVELEILYNNKHDIAPYVGSFSFTDNSDKTDDISITLADRDKKWLNEWFVESGDTLNVKIKLKNWKKQGDNRELNLGKFEVDQVTYSETVTINAVSAPITSSIRSVKKTKAWEKVRLKKIVSDIAKKSKLKVVYESNYNPYYKRKDQDEQSDLEFIEELCKDDGLCVKVSNEQLVVFEEYKFDAAKPKYTFTKDKSNIVGTPSFSRNAKNIYKACEIKYHNEDKDKTYRAYYETKDVFANDNTLRFKEECSEVFDATTLKHKARSRLREQNKNEWKLSISLVGDIAFSTGDNFMLVGYGKFDGKYNIESINHSIGGGYTVDISARKCLDY